MFAEARLELGPEIDHWRRRLAARVTSISVQRADSARSRLSLVRSVSGADKPRGRPPQNGAAAAELGISRDDDAPTAGIRRRS
jgi:hypothetical protein